MPTTPIKIVLAALVAGLIGAGFYLVDWQERHAELARLEQTLEERQQKLASSQEAIRALPVLTAQLDELEKQMSQVVASTASEEPKAFVANYLADVERLVIGQRDSSNDPSLSIVSIAPGNEEKTTAADIPGLSTRIFQMQMTGRYASLADLLDELSQMKLDRLVTINKITLTPQGRSPGESPVLSVSMPVTAYLRQGVR